MAEEITVSRIINAPRELVWRAWTDADLIRRWWGPKRFTSPAFEMDVRVGGDYMGAMRDRDGQENNAVAIQEAAGLSAASLP